MKEIIKTIINEQQKRVLPEIKPRTLEIPVNIQMIISLIGARRCGKTYLLYSVIKKLRENGVSAKQIVFLNFEDERLNLQTNQLDLILQAFYELQPEINISDCYFFFDEIQNIDGWEKFVRRIFDNITKNIYITGSNSKLLSTEIATSLRGRTITYTVFPLSLHEYLNFNQIEIDLYDTQKKARILQSVSKFLKNGGFPEIIDFDDNTRLRVLQSYFNTMIYRDIIERYKISDPSMLKFFIKKIFASVGKPISINKIYNELRSLGYKVSNNYLYDFLEYCNTIFLTLSIPKFHFSEIKQEKSDKKIYCIDTGLLSAVEFTISENKGKLFENLVLLELLKSNKEVFYFKEKYECDFICRENGNFEPIQVSYIIDNEETKERELRGLHEACQFLNVKGGYLLTFDTEEELIYKEINVKIIPFYKYFLI